MKRYHQYQPLLVSDFEADQWQHPEHNHNHYELIYIKKGRGAHVINQLSQRYQAGSIFLLGPDDEHYFDISSPTRFIYLKFTDPYRYKEISGTGRNWQHLEYLIKSRETHLAGYQLSAEDRRIAGHLFDTVATMKHDTTHNEQLIWLQLLAIATILQRNMPELKELPGRSQDMQAMYCYLHKNIYSPEQLRAPAIAAQFNMTADYVGPYFKRNTGTTLRDYIQDYRKALINQRLASKQYSLKEIAAEFGLTDESHVKKLVS
ncbi:AraC family transcriptional regulator [Paraflavitalea sp. CAU 1676]|uniref:AraC family transcriptional regulator n=1 Tax=Paraflavitalea sp. CAU 1676 TaxID=3032598 RepID=UPI0023D9D2D9|nr:AraC family transcriptional regulator [Paraflavitalea sp. CAU 1676]MDF2192083.1 AraC family transcriptional regulator [Paraflavitalea sp. CAU 1676]